MKATARAAGRSLRGMEWREDDLRSARLLFDAELDSGALSTDALEVVAVRRGVHVRPVPPQPVRAGEQILYRLGRLPFERTVIDRLLAARCSVLGEGGEAMPRILIRVDEFPHYQAWDQPQRFGTEQFKRFHEILAGAGVPYLLAVSPRVSRAPLSPDGAASRELEEEEVSALRGLAGEGVAFALHGRDHRSRFASPRRRSELCGLAREQTERLIDGALAELAEHGIATDVFVPPFNRLDARQLPWLAGRFAIVCGGPESIGKLGFQVSPQWRGETVYLPSYAPFYGRAAEVRKALPGALERACGLWLPVVLHWGWEADAGWGELEQLAAEVASCAAPWEEFLAAVKRSRDGGETGWPTDR